MLVSVPFSIAFGPSLITQPVDVFLGLAIPIHAHIGMNAIAADYIPTHVPAGIADGALFASRCAILATTTVLVIGLFDLNCNGAGITGALKALWTHPPHHKEGH